MEQEKENQGVTSFSRFALKVMLKLALHYVETARRPCRELMRDFTEVITHLIK